MTYSTVSVRFSVPGRPLVLVRTPVVHVLPELAKIRGPRTSDPRPVTEDHPMQLPDENIEYHFQRLLVPLADGWTPLAELQTQHLLPPDDVERIKDRATKVRGQVVAERELQNPPAALRPLQPGFIDLPQKMLDGYKRKQDASELGKVLRLAQRLRDTVDRVVVLGIGGS